ncbi:Outer membrane protein TolC [Paenimyroides aquimaris]|uniref:Outer membrane protein TolC n=1 Tax=Paenimyroides marinum TaxID=1159016 RepID=A0A1H6LA09_9FLAO|nr:TolC family protein [Paenimyroides aquimaris]SEH85194.1 Outer membrane protein TolC [Paenimyroides aquimaris]
MKKLGFTVVSLICGAAFGQIQVSPDIEQALNAALKKDVTLVNQTIERQKLELERKSVLTKYIPKVEATALYGYLNTEGSLDLPTLTLPVTGYPLFNGASDFSTDGQAFHGNVMAKAVLFSGGQIYNGAKALAYKNEGTGYMMDLQNDAVIKDILYSFDQLQMLKIAEQLINDSEKRLDKENERVEKAISLGLAIPYDRDKIKLARLELESKKTDVQHKQNLLVLKINQSTGMDDDDILQVNHSVEPIVIFEELSSENKNEIKALQSFQKASEYALKKEKGSLLPTLGAFGGYSYTSIFNAETKIPINTINQTTHLKVNNLTLNPTWMVGVALKWELFSGFERKHKIEEAELNTLQIENKLNDAKEKLGLQLKKNKIEYENMLLQISIAKQREIVAKNNNEIAAKQYKAGLISITERLTAENDIYKESLNKIETIIKQRQAAIETYQSAGSLMSFITIH